MASCLNKVDLTTLAFYDPISEDSPEGVDTFLYHVT